MKKKIILFGIFYVVLFIPMSFLIFSWNAFGGSNNINLLQKIAVFFFTFPGNLTMFSEEYFFIYPIINVSFWGFIFYVILILLSKYR